MARSQPSHSRDTARSSCPKRTHTVERSGHGGVHAKIPKGYTYEKESGKINPGGYTIDKAVEEGILEVSE